jgi:hypothetical protein
MFKGYEAWTSSVERLSAEHWTPALRRNTCILALQNRARHYLSAELAEFEGFGQTDTRNFIKRVKRVGLTSSTAHYLWLNKNLNHSANIRTSLNLRLRFGVKEQWDQVAEPKKNKDWDQETFRDWSWKGRRKKLQVPDPGKRKCVNSLSCGGWWFSLGWTRTPVFGILRPAFHSAGLLKLISKSVRNSRKHII